MSMPLLARRSLRRDSTLPKQGWIAPRPTALAEAVVAAPSLTPSTAIATAAKWGAVTSAPLEDHRPSPTILTLSWGASGLMGPGLEVHPRVTSRPYPQGSMVDLLDEDLTPCQAPTLTELEEARAYAAMARHVAVEGLMASDDPADVGILLAELVNRPAWHALANCRGADPDLFFPERGDRPAQALAYCAGCPARSQCLDSALEVASTSGVWGGTTGAGRRGLRRSVA